MPASNTTTTIVSGIVFARSIGPGSALPNRRKVRRFTASHRAPAMCPPSSGRSGTMLSTNRPMFSDASSPRIVYTLSTTGTPLIDETVPIARPTPTTDTGLSCERACEPKAAFQTATRRCGRSMMRCADAPIWAPVAGSTAAGDCRTSVCPMLTPTTPTRWVFVVPSLFFATVPSAA